jgi:hypothetical protein
VQRIIIKKIPDHSVVEKRATEKNRGTRENDDGI